MGDHPETTTLKATTVDSSTFLEGQPGQPYMRRADDVTTLIGECFSAHSRRALLYADNLPPAFFDVSSREAGTVLQKLRNYGVRLAVVAQRDSVPASSRFHELLAAERRDGAFGLFETREAAVAWLAAER
jgi:hypothetical protein